MGIRLKTNTSKADNDSILNALAENNPETLDKAPASFSRSKEIICLIIKQVPFQMTNAFHYGLYQMQSWGKHFRSDP